MAGTMNRDDVRVEDHEVSAGQHELRRGLAATVMHGVIVAAVLAAGVVAALSITAPDSTDTQTAPQAPTASAAPAAQPEPAPAPVASAAPADTAVSAPAAAAPADTTADGHNHTQDPTAPAAALVDDKGFSLLMNGHQHDAPVEKMDAATTGKLAKQLARTAELVDKYPLLKDAEAAGYRRQGPFAPGLGTHYSKSTGVPNPTGVITDENVLDTMLIYNGTEPDSPLVGFMYNAFMQSMPEGFAGPNDVWHYHTNVCIAFRPDGGTDAPLGADRENVSADLCKQYNGVLIPNTGYMVHVWTVPGWENPLGVFHETHPGITCADGTYWMKPIEELGTSLSVCKDAP